MSSKEQANCSGKCKTGDLANHPVLSGLVMGSDCCSQRYIFAVLSRLKNKPPFPILTTSACSDTGTEDTKPSPALRGYKVLLWVGSAQHRVCPVCLPSPLAPFCFHSAPTMCRKRSKCSFSHLEVILIVCLTLMIMVTVVLLILHFLAKDSNGKLSYFSPPVALCSSVCPVQ